LAKVYWYKTANITFLTRPINERISYTYNISKTNYKRCFIANMLFSPQLRVRIAAGIEIGVVMEVGLPRTVVLSR
jgi:hypothetical protein